MIEHRIKVSASKIKAKLAEKGYFTIKDAAEAIETEPDLVSQTINYLRENASIRIKIAELIGVPVDKLFDKSIPCVPAKLRERVA
jgi:hypothetical protein